MKAGRGHLPSCYSCVEIVVALYYSVLVKNLSGLPDRDRVIISKGHGGAVLYPVLADLGYFPMEELNHYCEPGALLGMYASPKVPGVEALSDSLGHGLGIGAGMALAAKQNGQSHRVFVILGDAECDEGSIWETASFACNYKLNNLIAIVDINKLGILGKPMSGARYELLSKLGAFGWGCSYAKGHDFENLLGSFDACRRDHHPTLDRPQVILADTVKGKGISFMEGKAEWHNKIPDQSLQMLGRLELGLEKEE